MKIKINDIAKLNQSSMGSNDNYEFIHYLDTSSITKGKIDSWQQLTGKFPSRAKRRVEENTIIYSTVRPNQEHYGFFDIIDKENSIVSTGFTTIDVISSEIYPKYLYYLLTQNWVTNYLQTLAENAVSAYPSITPSDIGNLKFNFPKLEIQKKIVNILSNIDNKISLNNQLNDNLEKQAKLLYDYWFVQNADENWEVKKLGEIAYITMGQSPAGKSYNENKQGTVFYQGSTDFGWRFPTVRQYTTAPTRFAKLGDILLSVRAPVGTLNIANENCCIGRGLSALNSKDGFNSYLLYLMSNFKKRFDNVNSVGTTFG